MNRFRTIFRTGATVALLLGLAATANAQTTAPPASGTPGSIPAAIVSIIGTNTTMPTTPVTAAVGPAGAFIPFGNTGLSFPPGALPVNASVTITPNPSSFLNANFGGPGQSAPGGTNFDVTVTDATTGAPITAFAQAVTIVVHPGPADLSFAIGDIGLLTFVYVVDANTPAAANPLHAPANTRLAVPNITRDAVSGDIATSLNFLGSTLAVVTNPVGYVQTVVPRAGTYSSFDPATGQQFGTKPPLTYLQVVEPQIGDRLIVLDPDTGNYAYVNAKDVGPSGPPPPKSSSAVVRGEQQF